MSRSKLTLNQHDGAQSVKQDGYANYILAVLDARSGADSGICVRLPGLAFAGCQAADIRSLADEVRDFETRSIALRSQRIRY